MLEVDLEIQESIIQLRAKAYDLNLDLWVFPRGLQSC